MHEGKTLGESARATTTPKSLAFGGEAFVEFPLVAGHREIPRIIATGQTVPFANKMVAGVVVDIEHRGPGPKGSTRSASTTAARPGSAGSSPARPSTTMSTST